PLRELRQLRDLGLRELAGPALRAVAQLLRGLGREALDLRVPCGGEPPLPRQEEVEDLALDAGALPVGIRLIVDGGDRQVLRGRLDDRLELGVLESVRRVDGVAGTDQGVAGAQ